MKKTWLGIILALILIGCTAADENGFYLEGSKIGINKYTSSYYNKEGYNIDGYSRDGYDEQGKDVYGYNRDGYDEQGYDMYGYNRDGYNKQGYDKDGYHRDGYNKQGYDKDGYNKQGYDKDGYDAIGNNADDISEFKKVKIEKFNNYEALVKSIEETVPFEGYRKKGGFETTEEYELYKKETMNKLIKDSKCYMIEAILDSSSREHYKYSMDSKKLIIKSVPYNCDYFVLDGIGYKVDINYFDGSYRSMMEVSNLEPKKAKKFVESLKIQYIFTPKISFYLNKSLKKETTYQGAQQMYNLYSSMETSMESVATLENSRTYLNSLKLKKEEKMLELKLLNLLGVSKINEYNIGVLGYRILKNNKIIKEKYYYPLKELDVY